MRTGNHTVQWHERLVPTSTVHQARLQIFQPTRTPTYCTREIETAYGDGAVTGRLGQMHALLLEAICFTAERTRVLENGSLQVLIDPHKVRRMMSASARYSAAGIAALTADLRGAVIQVRARNLGGLPAIDGILDRLVPSPATRLNPLNGEMRYLMRAELSPTWRAWTETDLALHYDPSPLAALRHGASAAVARWVLTQRGTPAGGWYLDTLLAAVGVETTDRAAMRNRRRDVRQDADRLAAVGIEVQGDRVARAETKGRVLDARGRVLDARGV